MKYTEGMTFLEYIGANMDVIKKYRQPAIDWTVKCQCFKSLCVINCAFKELVKSIPKKLDRSQVASCFKENLYKGVIATLLWGGAHRANISNFRSVIKARNKTIEKSLERIRGHLANNEIEVSLLSMLNGENKIKGIGISYITKILYFLSYNDDCEDKLKPLIFDKWARYFHCALIIDEAGIDMARKMYSCNGGNIKVLPPENHVYLDYLNRMKYTSTEYQIDQPDILEASLFGLGCNITNDCKNPRLMAKDYVFKTLDKCGYSALKSYLQQKKIIKLKRDMGIKTN
jgi:hypothetical protein